MMVRPILGVVAELGDVVDLVLGLDVAVLGDAEVDADAGLIDLVPVEPGVA